MNCVNQNPVPGVGGHAGRRPARGFTLVELLTVVAIISLLIGILIPSLSAARTAAKKAVTAKTIKTIEAGLEMFRQDNETDFPQTNGYPASFSHPPIRGYSFAPQLGEFPFRQDNPTVYGAMWLPAMLMGVDKLGYIGRRTVPNRGTLRQTPSLWYTPAPAPVDKMLDRSPFYLDPDSSRTLKLKDLPGRPPDWWAERDFDSAGDNEQPYDEMTVIIDAFDYPILYYAAQRNGRATNLVADEHDPNNEYDGGVQQTGVPYYFHDDNHGFTGHATNGSVEEEGWDFSGAHPLAEAGGDWTAADIADPTKPMSFARYVVDRKLYRDFQNRQGLPDPNTALRPVNDGTFLLISPGPDGKWGTSDDVSNLPPFLD